MRNIHHCYVLNTNLLFHGLSVGDQNHQPRNDCKYYISLQKTDYRQILMSSIYFFLVRKIHLSEVFQIMNLPEYALREHFEQWISADGIDM